MANEYLIGIGVDGEKLFKNLKDTIGLMEQVEAKSGEVGKTVEESFNRGGKASEEFDKKIVNTSKNIEVVSNVTKVFGKEMAESLSGKNIDISEFTKKIDAFKKGLADVTTKKSIGIKIEESAIKELKDLSKYLRENFDKIQTSLNEGTLKFQSNINSSKENIKALNADIKNLESTLKGMAPSVTSLNLEKEIGSAKEALLEETAILNQNKEGLIQVTDANKNLSNEIKKANSEIEKFGNESSVGEVKVKTLRVQLLEMKETLASLENSGKAGTDEFINLSEKAGELENQIKSTNSQVKALASDTGGFDGLISGVQGLVGAFAVAQGVAGLFGDENEELQKALLRVNSAMAILQGLQQLSVTLNKDSAFSILFLRNSRAEEAVATVAQTEARAVLATATTAEVLATETLATAQATQLSASVAVTVASEAHAIANTEETASALASALATEAETIALREEATATLASATASKANAVANVAQASGMTVATVATKALRIGLATIGIGLIIALVAYLVANWDKLKKSMEGILPSTKEAGKAFDNLKAIFLGVGTALVEYVIAPVKIAIALFTEGLDGAVKQAKKSYDLLGNYAKGHKQQIVTNAIDEARDLKKTSLERWDNEIKIAEAEGKDTYATKRKWYQNKIRLAQQEGEDSKELTQELLEFEAKKRGEDRKKAEDDAKQKAERAKKDAEDARKKAEENAKKEAELKKKQNEQILKFADELKNSEILNIDDKTKREREALEKQLDDKIKAIESEKALTKTAEETQTKILINLRKDKAAKLNEFDANILKERFKLEMDANKEIASLKKESLDSELDLLIINSQSELDAINEKYKNEEELRLKLIEETEKNTAEKSKEIKKKYSEQALKDDEERAILGIELSSTYAKKSEETELQKQIAIANVKLEFANKFLDSLIDDGSKEAELEKKRAEKAVKDAQNAVNEAVANNNGKDFDFLDFLGIGEGLDDDGKKQLKDTINKSMEVLKDFTSFMIDNIDQQIEKKQEQREQTQNEIDDLEDQLDEEKQLRDDGFANNVELIEAELAEKQKQKDEQIRQEQELLEKKKALQKVQLAMDTASQLSGLITASVDIWKGFMAISPLLAPLAVGVIGLMFGTFVASKAKAYQSIEQQTVKYGEGGEISGRSHAQGGEKYYNADGSKVRELEDGEFVVRKKQYKKFNNLVKAINNDDFSNLSVNDYAISEMFRSLGFDFNTGVDEARNLQLTLMTMGYGSGESKHLAEISQGIAQLVESEKSTPKSWSDGVFNYLKDGGKIRKTRIIPLKIEDEN